MEPMEMPSYLCNVTGQIVMLPVEKYIDAWK